MKNLKRFTVLMAGIALFVMACSKGDTGPTGPAGPPGPDSVIHSPWILLNMKQNVIPPSDTFYTQTLVTPKLTHKILDSGIILTYLGIKDNANVMNVFTATPYFTIIIYYADSIYLESAIDLSGVSFRYVLVPGSVNAGTVVSGPAKGMKLADLQTMSYAAVQKLLGTKPGEISVGND